MRFTSWVLIAALGLTSGTQAIASPTVHLFPSENIPTALGVPVTIPSTCTSQRRHGLMANAAPVVLFFFNAILASVEREMRAKEAADLERLSVAYGAQWTGPAEISSTETKCFTVVRVAEDRGDRKAAAVYTFALRPVGDTAFTVEVLSAQVNTTPFEGEKGASKNGKAHVDLGLTLSAVVGTAVPKVRALQPYPTFQTRLSDVELGKAAVIPAARSSVWPLPETGSPITVTVAVTESDTGLKTQRQQAELRQSIRAGLWEALGKVAEAKLAE